MPTFIDPMLHLFFEQKFINVCLLFPVIILDYKQGPLFCCFSRSLSKWRTTKKQLGIRNIILQLEAYLSDLLRCQDSIKDKLDGLLQSFVGLLSLVSGYYNNY